MATEDPDMDVIEEEDCKCTRGRPEDRRQGPVEDIERGGTSTSLPRKHV